MRTVSGSEALPGFGFIRVGSACSGADSGGLPDGVLDRDVVVLSGSRLERLVAEPPEGPPADWVVDDGCRSGSSSGAPKNPFKNAGDVLIEVGFKLARKANDAGPGEGTFSRKSPSTFDRATTRDPAIFRIAHTARSVCRGDPHPGVSETYLVAWMRVLCRFDVSALVR